MLRPLLLLLDRTGRVLLALLLGLALENLAVGLLHRDLIAGPFEMGVSLVAATPIALAVLVLPALVLAAASFLAPSRGRWVVGVPLAAAAAAVGYLSTGGRVALAYRWPIVFVLAATALVATYAAFPRLHRFASEHPDRAALVGFVVGVVAWTVDARVLPRLYPAFHGALGALALTAFAALALALRRIGPRPAYAVVALGLAAAAFTPRAAHRLRSVDNLRLVLVEHAPFLGRAVELAARISPVPPLEAEGDAAPGDGPGASGPRTLDWSRKDILLVTVDALRADHVGAYGYRRPTTPNLDALAARGARFDAAYCATPHTSYSVTSLMTGKYMRPLMALGVGDDSETWAGLLRRYEYRTAAFYPPAVFFIDEARFTHFRDEKLDFEYAKIEFTKPELRFAQVRDYLAGARRDAPLFLWVHLFEPHEPYEKHPEYDFGERPLDAYDGEVKTADALIGRIVGEFERTRGAGNVILMSADHGEEFGDHGGRYHGTTVYEEQVRVPLLVVAPGVAPKVVDSPAQTIDLLPTVLSALGIPRVPRLRGRDLGPALTGRPDPTARAFAETESAALYAKDGLRMVCDKATSACRLYDVRVDPGELHDVSGAKPAEAAEMRKALGRIERDHGRFEGARGSKLPEALRRGLAGESDAAPEVAELLDDANVELRREAARVLFRLRATTVDAALERARSHDEDGRVRSYATLALARTRGAHLDDAAALLRDPDATVRGDAALALAEAGDARGEDELVRYFEAAPDFVDAREILRALTRLRSKKAVPALVRRLTDVRLRPEAAEALGAIGMESARAPLLAAFEQERYLHARRPEALALLSLGAAEELRAPLRRFAGMPEPFPGALDVALATRWFGPAQGGVRNTRPADPVDAVVTTDVGPVRILVRGTVRSLRVDGRAIEPASGAALGVDTGPPGPTGADAGAPAAGLVFDALAEKTRLRVELTGNVDAFWVVPRSAELPPPPPVPVDGGAP